MVARLLRSARFPERSGHILVLAAVVSILLAMVVGLTVDSGLVYGKRARLSKAADAAAFAALTNLGQGNLQATRIAYDVFDSNYQYDPANPGTDYQAPTRNVSFIINSSNNRAVVIDAHAFATPLFGQILGLTQFNLSAHAEASRAKVVLSLALDRSGSMNANNGCALLPGAAHAFIDYFEEGYDRMSLTTYASDARLEFPLTTVFKAPAHAAVPTGCNVAYNGFTFIDGGLTLTGLQNATVAPVPGEDVVKVIVLFTDGLANTIHIPNLDCPPMMSFNISGSDLVSNPLNEVVALDSSNGAWLCSTTPGGTYSCCPNLLTFPSVLTGVRDARNAHLVRAEARDRSMATAEQLRLQGNYIYTIGLGDNLDVDFLKELANDPTGPNPDPGQPIGEFSHAPTAAELEQVFLRLARLITLRLSA